MPEPQRFVFGQGKPSGAVQGRLLSGNLIICGPYVCTVYCTGFVLLHLEWCRVDMRNLACLLQGNSAVAGKAIGVSQLSQTLDVYAAQCRDAGGAQRACGDMDLRSLV